MSYCRFSSDNWKSDVYCYYSVGDFYQIFVAENRIVEEIPIVDFKLPIDKLRESIKKQNEALSNCTHVSLRLPCDGESFECNTLKEMRDKLIELRKMGYHVPDNVFKRIDEELADNVE